MKIPAAIQPLVDSVKFDTPSLLKYMKPGQILNARVTIATTEGLAKLLIGGAVVSAKTPLPLKVGQQLLLLVEKGLPHPELKIQQTIAKQPAIEALRSAVAKQLTPKDVQQAVKQILQNPTALISKAALGSTPQIKLQLAAQGIRQQIPSIQNPTAQTVIKVLLPNASPVETLTSTVVKKAMQHSGILFESNLAQGKAPPQDQKLKLLQLLRLFTPQARAQQATVTNPAEQANDAKAEIKQLGVDQLMNRLLRLVEGSISRIQSHQASSLVKEENNLQIWQFEIPIQTANKHDHLNLRIQREDTSEEELEKIWKVDIDFDFDDLGEIHSRINLNKEDVSAAFWCKLDSTATLIESQLPKLEDALHNAGLKVSGVSSLVGEPPKPQRMAQTLLDEHA